LPHDSLKSQIIKSLGYTVLNFDINSHDFDKTKSAEEIAQKIMKAREGSIIIMHMNHPSRNTAKAVKLAVPQLKEKGFTFVKIHEFKTVSTY
jgi:peptidoglycan/xylan/chitin deacetylase (PgdA/CDA1 family)